MKILLRLPLSLLVLTMTACSDGGSSSGESAAGETPADFRGLWDVTYLVLLDDCGLVPEDVEAFEDEQFIEQNGDVIELESASLPSGFYEGDVRDENSFRASALLEGDLFGDGVFCQLIEDIAFDNTNGDVATSLYRVTLSCADGFVCDSTIRGNAHRVPESELEEVE